MTGQKNQFDFNPVAGLYDGWYESREGRRFDLLEKRAVESILKGISARGRLLEVGSGTGWWSRFFARRGFTVTGVDVSPQMVRVARNKGIPGAVFQEGDAHNLACENGEFDVAAAITVLEFTGEPQRVLREMVRCTRMGGMLVLGVLNAESPLNRARSRETASPYAAARFFSAIELRRLLSPLGRVRIIPCAFALSVKLPPPFGGWLDGLLARLGQRGGAFLAAEVILCGSKPN